MAFWILDGLCRLACHEIGWVWRLGVSFWETFERRAGMLICCSVFCTLVFKSSIDSLSPGYTRFKDCGCKTNRALILSVASSTVGISHGKFNHSAILDR